MMKRTERVSYEKANKRERITSSIVIGIGVACVLTLIFIVMVRTQQNKSDRTSEQVVKQTTSVSKSIASKRTVVENDRPPAAATQIEVSETSQAEVTEVVCDHWYMREGNNLICRYCGQPSPANDPDEGNHAMGQAGANQGRGPDYSSEVSDSSKDGSIDNEPEYVQRMYVEYSETDKNCAHEWKPLTTWKGQCVKCGGYREVPMDENGKAK